MNTQGTFKKLSHLSTEPERTAIRMAEYGNFLPQDPGNLRTLADWLDSRAGEKLPNLDNKPGEDLRRIADTIEARTTTTFPDWRVA